MTVEAAYRHCRAITRSRAGNFSYGIRLLPRAKRDALSAVYALARRIDDIADGDLAAPDRLEALAHERNAIGRLASSPDDPVHLAVADAAGRYAIPLAAFGDLIDGAEDDVRGARYETWDELEVYCRRVAGSIGRLSLGIFGTADREAAEQHADDLGVALQLTNILRDIREDLATGRVYLPQEDLDRFGCELGPDGVAGPIDELVRFEAARAREWFARGLQLLPLLDRQSATCVSAMAGIYRRLLDLIERRPEAVLVGRVSLTGWDKGWVAARSLTTARAA
jgi:phytoene synthase